MGTGWLGEKQRLPGREVEILPPCGRQNDTGACFFSRKAAEAAKKNHGGSRAHRTTFPIVISSAARNLEETGRGCSAG